MVSGLDLARAPRRAPLTARKKGSGYENGLMFDMACSQCDPVRCDQTFSAVITKRCAEILPNWIFFYQTRANSAF